MKYIDVHTHLNLKDFAEDQAAAISRMREEGVGAIVVGVDEKTSREAVALAESNDHIWASVGLHPNDIKEGTSLEWLSELSKHPKVVAIGECGLDYFRSDENLWELQKEFFEKQITIAKEAGKPLMLHIRKGEKDAYQDALDILNRYPDVQGNAHFFAGNVEHAQGFFDLGYTISFPGTITFTHDYDEVVQMAPLAMLHGETDAPYATPVPYRGTRNEPIRVIEIYKKIAELKELGEEEVRLALLENAKRVFKL